MKLAGCGKEIYVLLSQLFKEGIVVTLSRQLNQIHFSLPSGKLCKSLLHKVTDTTIC